MNLLYLGATRCEITMTSLSFQHKHHLNMHVERKKRICVMLVELAVDPAESVFTLPATIADAQSNQQPEPLFLVAHSAE